MATGSWRAIPPLTDTLYDESYRFDFFQAVRILEWMNPDRIPVGEGSEPEEEVVQFSSKISLSFPPSDIHDLQKAEIEGDQDHMVINYIGLAGVTGPLPLPYTAMILERVWHKDTAFRDFLNIFNHRLASLLYRVRKIHRPGFEIKAPDQTHFADKLFAIMGLGTRGTRGRMKVHDRALLHYAELFAQKPRSMQGLEQILQHYFDFRVKGRPLAGQWRWIDETQVTMLGTTGQNTELGYSAVIGGRVWDQDGKFELEIGPLDYYEFMDLLPIGSGFGPLCELSRFYCGIEYEFDLELLLKRHMVPESRLGGADGPRLGWTSWLKTKPFEGDYGRVTLSPRLLSKQSKEGTS